MGLAVQRDQKYIKRKFVRQRSRRCANICYSEMLGDPPRRRIAALHQKSASVPFSKITLILLMD